MNPTSIMFSAGIIFSSILIASMNSWFTSWVGLEMNFMCFLMILALDKESYSMESLIKYFLIQTLTGQLFLLTVLVSSVSYLAIMKFMFMIMLIKLGMPPLHWWFPSIAQLISWDSNIILMTLQKMGPLFILQITMSTMQFNKLTVFMVIMGMFISTVMGVNQFQLRKLLAYSSMSHLGWIILGMMSSNTLWVKYFLIYCVMSTMLMLALSNSQLMVMNDFMKSSNYQTLVIMIMLLNLSGIPPLAGFYPKLMIFNALVYNHMTMLSLIIIMISLISFFFYFRMSWTIMSSSPFLTPYHKYESIYFVSLMIIISMTVVLIMFC